MNRLQERYLNEIQPALMKKFNYSTVMQCPKVVKIVVNMGVGDSIQNSKLLDDAVADLTQTVIRQHALRRSRTSYPLNRRLTESVLHHLNLT